MSVLLLAYPFAIRLLFFIPAMLIEGFCRRAGLSRLETVNVRWWVALSWPGYFIARSKLSKLKPDDAGR